MVDSNVLARHGWDFHREDLESLDYHVINAQGFGKSNTLGQRSLEGMSHGIVRVAIRPIQSVEGYHDGVLLSKSSEFGFLEIQQRLSSFQKYIADGPSKRIGSEGAVW